MTAATITTRWKQSLAEDNVQLTITDDYTYVTKLGFGINGGDNGWIQFDEAGNELRLNSNYSTAGIISLYTSNTPRLTINGSGNVGIGTSSPYKLLTTSTSTAMSTQGNAELIRLASTAQSGYTEIGFSSYDNQFYSNVILGSVVTSAAGYTQSDFYIATKGGTTNVAPTERMRITSGGNVLIGTTTDAGYTLYVNGNNRFSASKASEVVLISNTRNSSSGDYAMVTTLGANANNTSSYHLIAATGGADKFYIYGNGTYTTVSDKRLKKNISSVTDAYLDKVLRLNIVNYNWNDQDANCPLEFGMIAQEVEELIPSIVHEGRKHEDGNVYKGIQASVLPYILIKAIQEQQKQIEELKQLVATK